MWAIGSAAVYDFKETDPAVFFGRDYARIGYCRRIHARNSKVEHLEGCSLLTSLFVAAGSMGAVSLHALTPEKLISQFTHTAWSAQDGIPAPVRAIAQTPDGSVARN